MRVARRETKWRSWLTKRTVPLNFEQAVEQPLDRLDVEVVGRLVEHQHVVPAEHQLRQQEARGLAAGERLGGLQRRLAR